MVAREQVRRELKRAVDRLPELFAPGTRLVLGFSGGQDSTTLLHALVHLGRELDVVAAHIDHGLRAQSADQARRVADLAREIGASRVEVRRVDVAAYRQRVQGWSVQQAARAARYRALANIGRACSAQAVLAAHTADDQAETLLINLLRGTGLAGLAGMRMDETLELSSVGPPFENRSEIVEPERVRVARPLLRINRSTTLAYCAESGLSIVEDTSNQSRAYTRNRVRLDLLPVLERFNPAIRSVLARTAELAAEDVAALDAVVGNLHTEVLHTRRADGELLEYHLQRWRALPRALQRRLLRHGMGVLLRGLANVHAAPIDDALELVSSGTPDKTYHLPYGVELCMGSDTFMLRLHGRARPRARANSWGMEVPRV